MTYTRRPTPNTRPAPPPRRVRKCPHGWMRMEWVSDSAFATHGGYWSLRCAACEHEQDESVQIKARAARSIAAAPDYDEEAIGDALWAVVDAVLAS